MFKLYFVILDYHYREFLMESLDKIGDLIKSKQKKNVVIDS